MIDKLVQLQKMDLELDQFRNEVQEGTSKLEFVRNEFDKKQKTLQTYQQKVELFEKELAEQEKTLNLDDTRLKKSKKRLNEIKTSYEFQAMKREIESTERSIGEMEDSILGKTEEIQKIKKEVETQKQQLDEVQKTLEDIQKEVQQKTDELGKNLQARSQEKSKLESMIDKTLLHRYHVLRKRKYQNALVEVIDCSCQGCFMNIPPQMFLEILKKQEVFQCPNCQRLLYVKESSETSS